MTADVRAALVEALADRIRVVRLNAAIAGPRMAAETLDAAAVQRVADAEREWLVSERGLGDTAEARYNLALFYIARREPKAAETEYRAAIRLWPASYQVRHNLGMLLASENRVPEAEAEFRAVLDREMVPETAFSLGLLYGQEGRWRDAAEVLERCLAAAPTYPRARYNLGLAYEKAGDSVRALDVLERAADDPSTHAEAVRTIVDLARSTKDGTRLQRWALEAAKLDPSVADDPHLSELLGN